MITSTQATAAKELLSASKENYSLLKSLIVTAVKDSGTKKGDKLFNQKCKVLHSYMIHWLNTPRYVEEIEAVMSHEEFIAILESIMFNVENHPKVAENLSRTTVTTTSFRLEKLLEEFKQNVARRLALAGLVREGIRQGKLNK